jgi:Phasin protein
MDAVSLMGAREIYQMSNSNLKKPGGGPRARKVDPPRSQKPDQAPSLKPAPEPEIKRPIEAAVAAPEAVAAPVAVAIRAVAPANPASIDFQTIATAYGNYSRKSFEQTKSYVEKLAGVRSLDKAIEIQTEFVKQACETFVTESQAISELYSGLARQNFQRLEGTVARMIPAAR